MTWAQRRIVDLQVWMVRRRWPARIINAASRARLAIGQGRRGTCRTG